MWTFIIFVFAAVIGATKTEQQYSRSALIADCIAETNKPVATRGLGFDQLHLTQANLNASLLPYSIELNLGVKTCYWQTIYPLGGLSFGVWMPSMVGVYNYSNFVYTRNNRILPQNGVLFDNFYLINSNLLLDVECTADGQLGAVSLNINNLTDTSCPSDSLDFDSIFSCSDVELCKQGNIFNPNCKSFV